MVKTRFAPSPTGRIHLGNVRTALFNALFAYSQQGKFLLRIEDTDKQRSLSEHTKGLIDDLRWLSFDWQQGPECEDGQRYFQSQRGEIYQTYFQQLIEQNLAYPCFCTPEQLALSRKAQRSAGFAPRYAGTCASLSESEIQAKLDQGFTPSLRFKVPNDQIVEFEDIVRGKQSFATNDIGDFIIRKADQSPAFFFSNAIDDALMQVTHVLRGDDHLTNTPRQLLLLQALNLTAPQYAHIALIVGQDGSPLSKRHGSKSVQELRQQGYLPDAINNYLARLGHYYANSDYMSLPELAQHFNLQHLGKAPARFDATQLDYWQKLSLVAMSSEQILAWIRPETLADLTEDKHLAFIDCVRHNILFPNDVIVWLEVMTQQGLEYNEHAKQILQATDNRFFEIALQTYQQVGRHFSEWTTLIKQQAKVKGKALFQPLRVALTGQTHGPELASFIQLLSDAQIQYRLKQAQND